MTVHKQDMTVTEVVSCCLTLPLRTGPDIFALWVDHWEDEWVHDVRSVFSVLWFYFSHRQRPLPPMLPPSRSRWTLHVEVPAAANEVTADLDYASPATLQAGLGAGSAATEKLYVVNWNTLLLYPAGWTTDELTYNASLK